MFYARVHSFTVGSRELSDFRSEIAIMWVGLPSGFPRRRGGLVEDSFLQVRVDRLWLI